MESMADLTKRAYIFSEKASDSLSGRSRFSSGRFSATIVRFRLKGSCTDIIISKREVGDEMDFWCDLQRVSRCSMAAKRDHAKDPKRLNREENREFFLNCDFILGVNFLLGYILHFFDCFAMFWCQNVDILDQFVSYR